MRDKRFWWVLVLMTALAAPSRATTVLRVPLEEMARGADLVVRAVVRDVRADAGVKDGGGFTTRVTFEVRETLKGHATGPTLTIALPGGTDGQRMLHVPGMPRFDRGEEVVLFLERTRRGWVPSGLTLGKYTVSREDATSPARVRRSVTGVRAVVRQGGALRDAPTRDVQDDMTLDALRAAIRRGVQGGAR
jgi:hypothetical protein